MIHANNLYPMETLREVIFLKNFITNPNIVIGDYTYYHAFHNPENFQNKNVQFGIESKLIIGKFCQIAEGTQFILSDSNHQIDGFSTYPFFIFGKEWAKYQPNWHQKGDTVIGNDVWFSHRSVVMPGVQIGDGAIIAAFSVVTKDVQPYSVVAGNPAKLVRERFPPEIVEQLLKIQWWNWDSEVITKHIPAIVGADIEKLHDVNKNFYSGL